jgi:hypothetical protein
MNLILIRGGYRPVAIRPQDRGAYLDALEAAQAREDMQPYRYLMHTRLAETMDDYVHVLRETHDNRRALEQD